MEEQDSLAVGLAVGIPSFLVLLGVCLFYLRNRRRQRQEDLREQQIDLELQDNQSFSQFHEELHKPVYKGGVKPVNDFKESTSSLNNYSGSGSPSESGVSKDQKNTPTFTGNTPTFTGSETMDDIEDLSQLPRKPMHSKSNSAYDFYESFIPILPEGQENSESVAPPTPKFKNVLHRNNDSDERIIPNSSTSSIDKNSYNLAKQLHNQNFFEKLPSRAGTIKPPAFTGNSHSNSSLDLVNKLVEQNDAINDSYVYSSHLVAGNKQTTDDGKLSKVLGSQGFENSFENEENDATGDVFYK